MEKIELHLSFFSELKLDSGGIEKWAEYITNFISQSNKYKRVVFYYLCGNSEQTLASKKYENIEFIAINVGEIGKGTGKKNMLLFNLKLILKIISGRTSDRIHFVVIGGFYTSPAALFLKKVLKDNIILYTWLRSITFGEIKAVGSKFWEFSEKLEKKLLNKSDIIIYNGEDTYNYYVSRNPKYKDKSIVIPNALITSEFSFIDPVEYNKYKLKVVFLGRYSKAKGIDDFDRIAQLYAKKRHSNTIVSFHAYGYGDYKFSNQVQDHKKYSSTDLKNIFIEHSIVLFLNKNEMAGGLSHSLLETMSSGRIIIAWDNNIHNQILNEENSFLVEEGNYIKLINTIEYIESLSESEFEYEITRRGKNARKKALSMTKEKHYKKFEDVLVGVEKNV